MKEKERISIKLDSENDRVKLKRLCLGGPLVSSRDALAKGGRGSCPSIFY